MVSKGVVKNRIKRGLIPSKNFTNDRARTISNLFEIFTSRLPKDRKPKMINFATHILKEGERKGMFSGKDPVISGIIVFLISTEHFCGYSSNFVTHEDIKEKLISFGAGESFTQFKKKLKNEFKDYKLE